MSCILLRDFVRADADPGLEMNENVCVDLRSTRQRELSLCDTLLSGVRSILAADDKLIDDVYDMLVADGPKNYTLEEKFGPLSREHWENAKKAQMAAGDNARNGNSHHNTYIYYIYIHYIVQVLLFNKILYIMIFFANEQLHLILNSRIKERKNL